MAATQVLVSTLDGGRLLSFPFPTGEMPFTLGLVKQTYEAREGVPADELRISCNGRCLLDDGFIFTPEMASVMPPLRVGLRVMGGKGGFGSLLRGGNTRVGQKKMNNFEACRDLNGRRLRHVNNEKRLAEWYAAEKERELAKLGEKHARIVQKQHVFDEAAYCQSLETIEQELASSLQAGLEEARVARQQRQTNPPPPPTEAAWDFAYPDDSSDEEEEDEEEEEQEEDAQGEKEDKGKDRLVEDEEKKSTNKRERTEDVGEEDSSARPASKKVKPELETTTTCGKAALPTPPEWILG